jgi:hypothetical protein
VRWVGGLAIAAALSCLGWMALRPASTHSQPVPFGVNSDGNYVGARACGECHPGEYALFTGSGHARTLRPAARRSLARDLNGRRIADPERPGVTWAYALSRDRLEVERVADDGTRRLLIDYAFGSGHHATTFVSMRDPTPATPVLLEHRLTYYAATHELKVTPGQGSVRRGAAFSGIPAPGTTAIGRFVNGTEALKCFGCHTTRTSAHGAAELDPRTMIPNVSCEHCHGPGRAHVEAARRGADSEALALPFGPDRWTADTQLRLCGKCHRHPSTGGADLIRNNVPGIVRFQPVGLMQSRCYRESAGRLSCVTCHDPHTRVARKTDSYERACRSCHGDKPGQGACPISPRGGCVGCHMPRRDSGQNVLFTDHWIRVPRGVSTP